MPGDRGTLFALLEPLLNWYTQIKKKIVCNLSKFEHIDHILLKLHTVEPVVVTADGWPSGGDSWWTGVLDGMGGIGGGRPIGGGGGGGGGEGKFL